MSDSMELHVTSTTQGTFLCGSMAIMVTHLVAYMYFSRWLCDAFIGHIQCLNEFGLE